MNQSARYEGIQDPGTHLRTFHSAMLWPQPPPKQSSGQVFQKMVGQRNWPEVTRSRASPPYLLIWYSSAILGPARFAAFQNRNLTTSSFRNFPNHCLKDLGFSDPQLIEVKLTKEGSCNRSESQIFHSRVWNGKRALVQQVEGIEPANQYTFSKLLRTPWSDGANVRSEDRPSAL